MSTFRVVLQRAAIRDLNAAYRYGRAPWVYRSVFTLDGDTVRVLRIRRAQRRPLSATDLRKALESEQ